MKKLLTWFLSAFLLLPALASAQEAPDALIRRVSNDVLEKIKSDKDIQSGDLSRINQAVDQMVMPHVNFQRMTAAVVGRNWRAATPEQQKQLMTEFRTLLIRTYAGALSQVKDQQIRMKPFRGDLNADEVVVRSEVVQARAEPAQLDYRMQKTADGWKIWDVNVMGIWLVETYRNQFAQEVSQKGVDGLIRTLAERNRAPEAPAAPKRS